VDFTPYNTAALYPQYRGQYSNTSLLCPEAISITDQYNNTSPVPAGQATDNMFAPINSKPQYGWVFYDNTRYICSYSSVYTFNNSCWPNLPSRGYLTTSGFLYANDTSLFKLSAVPNPGRFVMHFEGPDYYRSLMYASANHSRIMNLSFFDGHVESVPALRNNIPLWSDVRDNTAVLKNTSFLWRTDQ
jgi:prepilin-type processing-associated H-X9-DG protein